MRQKLIAGNWKMFGSRQETAKLLRGLVDGMANLEDVELAVFPPFPYLAQTQEALTDTPIAWGAQNLSNAKSGAYTGEVSAAMLLDFDCRYVIVGHSERRQLYGETDTIVAAKFEIARDAGLIPIICVGETLAERNAGQTLAVVERQLGAILALDQGRSLYRAIVAYEPVWAIGTGETATPEQAEAVHQHLRQIVADQDETLAKQLRILYGGSVKRDNVRALVSMPNIDGGLVGGASLEYEHFLEIARLCSSSY